MPGQYQSGLMRKNSRFRELLAQGCARLKIRLDDEASLLLARYFLELEKWNRKINLIGPAPEQDIVEKHFLDSLTLLPFLRQHAGLALLDVGSGGGFPALAVKACLPELDLTMVEPRLKRVSFLKHIIRTLELSRTRVIAARLEPENPLFQDKKFPLISCRGLARISDFLELCRPVSPVGGKVICMKGPRADEELADWRKKEPASPFHLRERTDLGLPFSGSRRVVLIFGR